ncbi:MAG TPA: flavin reductase family protein [Actinomycetota bacterium]|nr:flavin reductase family protein [Actinomycetota bacterium]
MAEGNKTSDRLDDRENKTSVHYEDPFATPADKREPARRLRGRLAAPVTVWTSGSSDARVGLTVSSLLVAEGKPSLVIGLIAETTDLFAAILETGAFVVHVLDASHRVLADRFAGLRPSPGGLFQDLDAEDSDWGPVLSEFGNRACCRFTDEIETGYQRLVRGSIERIDLAELDSPLTYYRGRYRTLGPDERRTGAGGRDEGSV